MFDPNSRYYGLVPVSCAVPDGLGGTRQVSYVPRRFVPSAEGMATLAEHALVQGDRLDNITARYLGDPTQFWRVCDANTAMNPAGLTSDSELGRILRVPVPQV
jgi:hypothetical protein